MRAKRVGRKAFVNLGARVAFRPSGGFQLDLGAPDDRVCRSEAKSLDAKCFSVRASQLGKACDFGRHFFTSDCPEGGVLSLLSKHF